ncbi:MAG: hypothetical protein K6U11_05830 [bacterium]|nr:hypothetical protein [bacterium]
MGTDHAKFSFRCSFRPLLPLRCLFRPLGPLCLPLFFFLGLLLLSSCSEVRPKVCLQRGRQYCLTSDKIQVITWDACYRRAISCMEGQCWEYAIEELRQAIELRFEDQRQVRAYGMHFREEYFPHRELGICYFHLGRIEDALQELELSLSQTPSARAKYYLNQGRRAYLLEHHLDQSSPAVRLYLESSEDLGKTEPAEYLTNKTPVVIRGRVWDDQYVASILVNQNPVFIELAEASVPFSMPVDLTEGENVVQVVARDLVDREAEERIRIFLDRQGPLVISHAICSSQSDWRPSWPKQAVDREGAWPKQTDQNSTDKTSQPQAADKAPHPQADRKALGRRIILTALVYDPSGIACFKLGQKEVDRVGLDQLCLVEQELSLVPGVESVPFEARDRAGNITQGKICLLLPSEQGKVNGSRRKAHHLEQAPPPHLAWRLEQRLKSGRNIKAHPVRLAWSGTSTSSLEGAGILGGLLQHLSSASAAQSEGGNGGEDKGRDLVVGGDKGQGQAGQNKDQDKAARNAGRDRDKNNAGINKDKRQGRAGDAGNDEDQAGDAGNESGIIFDILQPAQENFTTYYSEIFLEGRIRAQQGIRRIELNGRVLFEPSELQAMMERKMAELKQRLLEQRKDPAYYVQLLQKALWSANFYYLNQRIPLVNKVTDLDLVVEDSRGIRRVRHYRIEKIPREEVIRSEQRMVLALLPFETAQVDEIVATATAAEDKPSQTLVKESDNLIKSYINDRSQQAFISQGRFNLVERGKLPWVLIEKTIQAVGDTAGQTDQSSAAQKIGRMVAAEGVICGYIQRRGDGTEIMARFIEVKTGLIRLYHDVFTPTESRESLDIITAGLAMKFRDSFPICSGSIISRQGNSIQVDFGSEKGIFPGMMYNIFEHEQELIATASITETRAGESEAEINASSATAARSISRIRPGLRVRTR